MLKKNSTHYDGSCQASFLHNKPIYDCIIRVFGVCYFRKYSRKLAPFPIPRSFDDLYIYMCNKEFSVNCSPQKLDTKPFLGKDKCLWDFACFFQFSLNHFSCLESVKHNGFPNTNCIPESNLMSDTDLKKSVHDPSQEENCEKHCVPSSQVA